MASLPRYYWDTSCFISLLSAEEEWDRHLICKDVLKNAQYGSIEIWTSTWTMVEVIKPRTRYIAEQPPEWAEVLEQVDSHGNKRFPKAMREFTIGWDYYKRHTTPHRYLTTEQADKIKGMFSWPFIKKIQVVPTIAQHAAEIARDNKLKPSDSLHVASALARKCDVLQHWDRHFERTDHLISSKKPVRISPDDLLSNLPPPEGMKNF